MTIDYIRELLEFIYGKAGTEIMPAFMEMFENFKKTTGPSSQTAASAALKISHKDALLITYGDMLSAEDGDTALKRLRLFLRQWNQGDFSYLHILPFHPYSSDDGFSVIDYRQVDTRLGSWNDIEDLAGDFKMTFDFVINHGSVKSEWFGKFLAGEERYCRRYLTRPADYDWSKVVRPRTHPLLTEFTKTGRSDRIHAGKVHVWTTFSADQADYDFSDTGTLLEFLGIFLDYYIRGGRMLRLDAIAYLWKEDGTACLHHPRTHAVVKLLRAITDYLGLPMLLLTETNVPHKENLSYFGGGFSLDAAAGGCPDGPEAHLVYNFALPPLVLHAAVSGDAAPLRRWAGELPSLPEGNCFLNFLASHDGVGLSPANGLVDEAAFAKTLETAQKRGALISMKSTPAGPVPYELNCSWADMVAPAELGTAEAQARAFLLTYAVALALPGLPAVYFHSWTGSRAWREGPGLLGYNRAINREKPDAQELDKELRDESSFRSLVIKGFHRLFEFRRAEDAFDPASPCKVLDGEGGIFALERESPGGRMKAAAVVNFSGSEESVEIPSIGRIKLAGLSLKWIAYDKTGIQRELTL
jgi:sucrose phosphorylase